MKDCLELGRENVLHAELIKKKDGIYKGLWYIQAGGFIVTAQEEKKEAGIQGGAENNEVEVVEKPAEPPTGGPTG